MWLVRTDVDAQTDKGEGMSRVELEGRIEG
jgi:hypothetical protein